MKKPKRKLFLLCACMFAAAEMLTISAATAQEQDWGVSAVIRRASVPFDAGNASDSVSTFIPMLHVENQYIFIDGMEAGAYLYQSGYSHWKASALLRLRYMDHPDAGENGIGEDTADFGFQLRYQPHSYWKLETELMSDPDNRFHSNYRISAAYDGESWFLEPSFTIRYKDADFNSAYYALSDFTSEHIGGGVDANLGINVRYHVYSNLYLLGEASTTLLDENAYNSAAVDSRYQNELFLGFGFFRNKTKPYKPSLNNRPYLRLAHGWATPSDVEDIFELRSKKDTYDNQMSSVFLGYPLTDELFGAPFHVYFTPGIAHHWSSSVQGSATEYIAAIKGYWSIDWPVKWRLGIAEGLSYIDLVTYIEATELIEDGHTPNRLLNYLDFSADINIGDLFNYPEWQNIWIGYSMHHRSALFKASSQFGRIKGGSNYNTIYIQYEF